MAVFGRAATTTCCRCWSGGGSCQGHLRRRYTAAAAAAAIPLQARLGEETPSFSGCPRLTLAGVFGVWDVITGMSNPPDRVAGFAVVHCLDVRAGPPGWLGSVLGGAAVELKELVAQVSATTDGENAVDHAVDAQVRDWRGTTIASTELSPRDNGYGLEDI